MSIESNALLRAKNLFSASQLGLNKSTDRLFGYLMACQYIGAIVWAAINAPRTWEGARSYVHPHVLVAILLGGAIALPTIGLAFFKSGSTITRWTVSVCQMLMSALLIHVSGGRIETHFSVFGSLAFLSFYRDWRLLVPATLVVLVDHIARGIYLPLSVYGVAAGAAWRFLEHAAWVVFEDVILIAACLRGVREMRIIADRQALVEATHAEVETLVQLRTQELRGSEERKGAILDNALDAIVSLKPNGVILEFNPAAEQMFQKAKSEVIGFNFEELLVLTDCGHLEDAKLTALLKASESQLLNQRMELLAVRDSGTTFPIELSITPVHLDEEVLYTAFIRDITERKRLQTELAHAQKMESIGQLATGVAHEINTPNQYIGDNIRFLENCFRSVSTSIDAYSKLLEASRTDAAMAGLAEGVDKVLYEADLEFVMNEAPRALSHALEGVDRVGSIVSAMKDFSHPGQEAQTWIDLNRVIRSTITVARNEWKYYATVEEDLDPDLPLIEGHPGALGQVVLNLIINAVHAIRDRFGDEPAGLIRVQSKRTDNWLVVAVTDNGSGIPEHARARVFEPFFTTKDVGIGTGQGLAISHAVICQKHRGSIDFDTTTGVGTTFTFRLPIDAVQVEAA